MTMTSLEISRKYALNIEAWQHQVNADFIDSVWDKLKPGGIWMWQAIRVPFEKTGERGEWNEVA